MSEGVEVSDFARRVLRQRAVAQWLERQSVGSLVREEESLLGPAVVARLAGAPSARYAVREVQRRFLTRVQVLSPEEQEVLDALLPDWHGSLADLFDAAQRLAS